jgi:hypothetical protein
MVFVIHQNPNHFNFFDMKNLNLSSEQVDICLQELQKAVSRKTALVNESKDWLKSTPKGGDSLFKATSQIMIEGFAFHKERIARLEPQIIAINQILQQLS